MARTRFVQFLHTILLELTYILLAIPLSLLAPIATLFIIVPVHCIRFLIAQYAKYMKPGLGKMLTARSSAFAVDDIYNKPRCNLCVWLVLEGDLSPEEFKDTFSKKVLHAKLYPNRPGSKELLNPELMAYVQEWCWFYFWTPVKNFSLDNHVIVPQHTTTDSSSGPDGPWWDHTRALAYNSSLIHKPWTAGQSPWEFHLLRNFQFEEKSPSGRTGLLFRAHHSLVDGYSVFNLLTAATITEFSWARPAHVPLQQVPNELRRRTRRILGSVLRNALFPLRIPYDAVKTMLESYDNNEWHNHVITPKLTGILNSGYVPVFQLTVLKEIKAHHRVSLTAVFLAMFTGAVRNYMVKTGTRVPPVIHALCPLPLAGHPKKLRNHMTGCFIELPVGTSDPVERLKKIQSQLKRLKSSTVPFSAGLIFPLIGGLFSWMTRIAVQHRLPTAVATNFPGPDRKIDVYGRPMVEINFGGGLMLGHMSIGMSSLSYDGRVSILIGQDQGLAAGEGVAAETVGPDLVQLVTDEIECLRKWTV